MEWSDTLHMLLKPIQKMSQMFWLDQYLSYVMYISISSKPLHRKKYKQMAQNLSDEYNPYLLYS